MVMIGLLMVIMGAAFWVDAKVLLGKCTARSAALGNIVAGAMIVFLCAYAAHASAFGFGKSAFPAAAFAIFGIFFLWYGIESLVGGDLRGFGAFLQYATITSLFAALAAVDLFGQTIALYWLSWGLLLFLHNVTLTKSVNDPRLAKIAANVTTLVSLLTLWVPGLLILTRAFF